MRMLWKLSAALAALLPSNIVLARSYPTDPLVSLNYATYTGTTLPNGVDQFIGMRYAAAPVGDLRWRAPELPTPQATMQKSDKFGQFCLGAGEETSQGGSEDCLFVNLWRPSNATVKSKLPVWIFIQGGGFSSNYSPNYNGSEVVETSGHNIIHINFNWRVGLYGFLAGRNVEAHGNLNAGLLDQLRLLQWVRENISKFGGDPNHVIVHGSSAGAGSVALHLLNPNNAGLFAGAIMESTFMPTQPHKTELEWQYGRLVDSVGCANLTAELQMICLRGKTTEELQKSNRPSPFPGRPSMQSPLWYWTPCIDGGLIPDVPLRMYQRGQFIKIPMIVGNNENEGAYFAANASTAEEVTTFMQSNYPRLSEQEIRQMIRYYPRPKPVALHAAWFPSAEQAYGESTLTCPAMHILDAAERVHNNHGLEKERKPSVWSYHMNIYDQDYVSRGLGCPHGYEEGIIFGPNSTNNPGRYQSPASLYTYNAPLVPAVMNYWISFVRTLSPNTYRHPSAPEWQGWAEKKSGAKLLVRLNQLHMEAVPKAQRERCAFWNGLNRSLLG